MRDRMEPWTWQSLPQGLIYRSYLAGPKEPRLGAQAINIDDEDWDWTLDGTLGARVGILRYGTRDPIWPVGFQIDIEGACYRGSIFPIMLTWGASISGPECR